MHKHFKFFVRICSKSGKTRELSGGAKRTVVLTHSRTTNTILQPKKAWGKGHQSKIGFSLRVRHHHPPVSTLHLHTQSRRALKPIVSVRER